MNTTLFVLGSIIVLGGALELIRPEFVAKQQRWFGALGTKRGSGDIQLTEANIALGRLIGAVLVVVGLVFMIAAADLV